MPCTNSNGYLSTCMMEEPGSCKQTKQSLNPGFLTYEWRAQGNDLSFVTHFHYLFQGITKRVAVRFKQPCTCWECCDWYYTWHGECAQRVTALTLGCKLEQVSPCCMAFWQHFQILSQTFKKTWNRTPLCSSKGWHVTVRYGTLPGARLGSSRPSFLFNPPNHEARYLCYR